MENSYEKYIYVQTWLDLHTGTYNDLYFNIGNIIRPAQCSHGSDLTESPALAPAVRGLSGRRPGAGIYQTGLFVMQQLSEVSFRDQPDPPGTEQTTGFARLSEICIQDERKRERQRERRIPRVVRCDVMMNTFIQYLLPLVDIE